MMSVNHTDYRSTRTHNGFYNPDVLNAALEIIGSASKTLVSDLDFLYNAVKNAYRKTEPLQLIEFDSIYSESGNLRQTHCKLS
jgi:hypothetical protein